MTGCKTERMIYHCCTKLDMMMHQMSPWLQARWEVYNDDLLRQLHGKILAEGKHANSSLLLLDKLDEACNDSCVKEILLRWHAFEKLLKAKASSSSLSKRWPASADSRHPKSCADPNSRWRLHIRSMRALNFSAGIWCCDPLQKVWCHAGPLESHDWTVNAIQAISMESCAIIIWQSLRSASCKVHQAAYILLWLAKCLACSKSQHNPFLESLLIAKSQCKAQPKVCILSWLTWRPPQRPSTEWLNYWVQ